MAAYKFALRTDRSFEAVRDFVVSKDISGFAVREVATDNEHWHWFLETRMKMNSFRELLRRAVPDLRGNGGYSVSQVKDESKYLRYMCKGDADGQGCEVAWKHGLLYTDEKIEELHTEYWTENRAMKKRRVAGGVLDAVIDQCKEGAVQWDERKAIGEMYIKELVARSKPINLFSVKSAVNLIQVKLCPDDSAIKELAERFIVA